MAGEPSDHRVRQAEGIVQSAMELVFSHGVSALSMSAIAQAAGVSRQTLYKYFPDVESVLRAAVQSSSHDTASITDEETAVEQLRAFIHYVLGAAAAELEAHAAQVRGMLAMILRRGMDEGTFRPNLEPDGDADIVYRTVMALSDLIAQAADVDSAIARAERSILAMVGYDR